MALQHVKTCKIKAGSAEVHSKQRSPTFYRFTIATELQTLCSLQFTLRPAIFTHITKANVKRGVKQGTTGLYSGGVMNQAFQCEMQ